MTFTQAKEIITPIAKTTLKISTYILIGIFVFCYSSFMFAKNTSDLIGNVGNK